MKEFKKLVPVAILGMVCLVGCEQIGNAPSGQSADEAKAAFDKKGPEEQIKLINASPMSPADKAQRIKEIRQKAGLPAEDAPAAPEPGKPGGPGANFPGEPKAGR